MVARTEQRTANRLVNATSPYLLQHAHNPVDWYEWGEEALAKAQGEDRPIFLSIGYAACHWCHVMAHESFENEEVAAALNRDFVSIKVDREERPDIDEIYMAYTQALTQHGGWPMSVWLAPDGTPFYAGTYFSKPQFLGVLSSIAQAWQSDRGQLINHTDAARKFFSRWSVHEAPAEGVIPRETVDNTAAALADRFDHILGGIAGGGTNKFPPSLDRMARGGSHDHLGGGICRYSTDVEWLVPHFEKMLYDQALVSGIYLDAYQLTREPRYAETAADILDYVLADLRAPEGGFYSSRDADSDGLEGAYYIWTVDEVQEALGADDGLLFCAYYDVTATGNWFESLGHAPEGPKSILHVRKPPDEFAELHGLKVDDFKMGLREWRGLWWGVRGHRTPPGLDDKILTGWNGLMIAALAKAARILDEPKYAEAAGQAADFILANLRQNGRLRRTYRHGEARLTGYLNDYAFLTEGLLNLYQATFDRRWLDEALALTETAIEYYYDEEGGGFFFTASDGEKLIARSKNPHDGAIPSGNSVQAMNLLRLAILFDRRDFREKAESILRAFAAPATQSPSAFEKLLCAADFYHDRVKEIAIIGDPALPETTTLVRTVFERYLPNKVVVHATDQVDDTDLPLLRRKTRMHGQSTAYVCEHYTCKRPVTTADALRAQLDAKAP